MSEPQKLPTESFANGAFVYCPHERRTVRVETLCHPCQYFKGIGGEFGKGACVFCWWVKNV